MLLSGDLARILDQLSGDHKQVLERYLINGESLEMVAKGMGISDEVAQRIYEEAIDSVGLRITND